MFTLIQASQNNLGSILMFAFNAILPIVLLIFFGYFLKKINFLSDDFVRHANKVVFRIALPVQLFLSIYKVESINTVGNFLPIVLYAALSVTVLFIIGIISVLLFTKDHRQKGVIIQTIVRSNFAIIGIPLVALLSVTMNEVEQSNTLAIASLMMFVTPFMNILTVVGLSVFQTNEDGTKKGIDWKFVFMKIVKNPLIIAVFIGLIFVIFRSLLVNMNWISAEKSFILRDNVNFIYKSFEFISGLTTPLALIALGATFKFDSIKKLLGQIIHGTVLRLIVAPVLGIGIALLLRDTLGIDKTAFPALVALFASPVAITSVVMAQDMGADAELQGQMVVWNSIFSILTLLIIIVILKSIGLL